MDSLLASDGETTDFCLPDNDARIVGDDHDDGDDDFSNTNTQVIQLHNSLYNIHIYNIIYISINQSTNSIRVHHATS